MKKPKKQLRPYANFLFEAGVLAKTPRSGFRYADELLQTDSNDWWYKNKEDEHWVKGGKGH